MASKTPEEFNIQIDDNKLKYYYDKILKYINDGERTELDIYKVLTSMFSCSVYLMNVFKKHPIDKGFHLGDGRDLTGSISTISDEMTWVVFLNYNTIICINDAMLSYIWPLRKILSETDTGFEKVNTIRLSYKSSFDETKHIGPRLFITESPLAMFEYFPSNYEPSYFTYHRCDNSNYEKILVNSETKHPRIKNMINKEIDDDNHYDYHHVNKQIQTPFRDNNILESLLYYYKYD